MNGIQPEHKLVVLPEISGISTRCYQARITLSSSMRTAIGYSSSFWFWPSIVSDYGKERKA